MGKQTTLAVIVGNRGFFPDHLCDEGRKEVLAVLEREGIATVALTPGDTPFGSVETRDHAHKWAALAKAHADCIDGVLVTLPNFGDERGIADALRLANLDVPVLVQAYPDEPGKMSLANRRDSFCGKMSACNNLRQYGIDYTLTSLHTEHPQSPEFAADLRNFAATCRVVRGLNGARIGAIGARPAAFNTVRFSEKLLEASGITVDVIDLSEIFGRMERLDEAATEVQARVAKVKDYLCVADVPEAKLVQMAKLATVIDEWMAKEELSASAVQCWTSIEEYMGIVPCTVMSMMSDNLIPSACEVDITGVVGMYALTLASGSPAALLDWNNNYGGDPDKCVLFHCSNLPKSIFADVKMGVQDIIGGSVGIENTYGTCVGRIASGPFTFCRISTDDLNGEIAGYLGEGEVTDDPLDTFGGAGVAHIEDLQELLRLICVRGFEHHVAMTQGRVGAAISEALNNYLGWMVYPHNV
ncbi:MAG: fucose isomerase [Armatimonadetes bacterium]|nr:fucose isomerase [Armatimonadota bacterium]